MKLTPHGANFIVNSNSGGTLSRMNYRFSGHETFPCRYAWLPKAYRALDKSPTGLSNDEQAMVDLGVGKNMVRAIRFWVQASGVAVSSKSGYRLTEFGNTVLGKKDPFLEDIRTLWLLHWKLSMNVEEPLFAWDFMLNRWLEPEFTRTAALDAFKQQAVKQDRKLSDTTLEHHLETFLHTYFPTRSRKNEIQEDNLDCPLVELDFIQKVGERTTDKGGRREDVFVFRKGLKPEISSVLFIYCLGDYWNHRKKEEQTVAFREICSGIGSVGQIFKLSESDVRERLDSIEIDSDGAFLQRETAAQYLVVRSRELDNETLLKAVYETEAVNA